ncbi:Teichuronic acid biosynthesis protein TuaB [Ureibacillus acetophenoni]
MNENVMKSNIITSLYWKFLERSGTQIIQFIVMLILARLLLPKDFGTIVIVGIFTTFASVIIQSGFSTALIQKKNTDELDYNSVFYLQLATSIFIYLLLFISSSTIAVFFDQPQLSEVIKVLSLILPLGAFSSIQNAIISRNMLFKKLFASSIVGILLSGTVGIYMAFTGFGIWVLVFQQLTYQLINTIYLLLTLNWFPKLQFSFNRVKLLFSYSWKLLLSSLIDTIDNDLRSMIIGRMFSSAMLGVFSKGREIPLFIVNNVNGSIQSVLFPALASI